MAKGKRAPADPKISRCFAEQMEQIITEGKYTNVSFAEKADISSEMVAQYRNGALPRADILYRISLAAKVPIDKLLTGTERKKERNCDVHCDDALMSLCRKLREIRNSGEPYKTAIESNILCFEDTVQTKRELKNLIAVNKEGRDGGAAKKPARSTAKKQKAG